jgi:hypothetical protein
MYDPVLRWKKSPSADVADYQLTWFRNGSSAGAGVVVRSATLDSVGYMRKFSQDNPGVAVGDGDVVGVSLRAKDEAGLSSSVVTPANVTVPSEPPEPPADVVLTLS